MLWRIFSNARVLNSKTSLSIRGKKAVTGVREAFGGAEIIENDPETKNVAFICTSDSKNALSEKLEYIKELVAVSVIPVL